MPSLKETRAANASLRTHNPDLALTAIFVGATAGLGLATLEAFLTHIPHPTAIIVGRSAARFNPHLEHLRAAYPHARLTFIEHEILLLADVDATSALIASQLGTAKADLLVQSQGYVSFAGREPTADGLDASASLRYHGRARLTRNLLPHLTPTARVLSILAGAQEGKLFEDDPQLERNYSVGNAMAHFASAMTLSYDALASQQQEPSEQRTFIHAFPGIASTGLLSRSAGNGVLGFLFRWLVEPALALLVAAPPADVGERMLYYLTAPGFGEAETGKCVAVDDKGVVRENEVLRELRARGMAGTVAGWEQRVGERVGVAV